MRNTAEKKADTREKILQAAGRLFRQYGVDAVGVDAVMRAAGLTHGGFYGHFASKEALVGEVAAASLARAASKWEQAADQEGADGVAGVVRGYLDPAHVTALERSCVLTTIAPDVSRRPDQRPALAASIRRMAAVLERGATDHGDQADPDWPLAALSTMVGAVILARLAEDEAAAELVLGAARRAVLGGIEHDGLAARAERGEQDGAAGCPERDRAG